MNQDKFVTLQKQKEKEYEKKEDKFDVDDVGGVGCVDAGLHQYHCG